MLPPITQDDVFFLLEPLLGLPILLRHTEITGEIAENLRAYRLGGDLTLDEVHKRISSALFNGIYAYTKGKMVVKDEQGRSKKIYTDDLSQMSEALMEPVFARLPVQWHAYEELNDYALHHLSLPAIKRLYLGYRRFMPEMNRSIFARIVKENFPKDAYEDWLGEEA